MQPPAPTHTHVWFLIATAPNAAMTMQNSDVGVAAGKVGDIYTALATAMGLETDAPEQVLLLAHLQRTASWQLQQYRDLEEPASSLQGWGRQHDDLLAYHYPSPERGPSGEGKRLLVWHT